MKSTTQDFFNLSPDHILDGVERALQREEPDLRATGRTLALNSLENRVYDVELEDNSHVVTKFYRPGRWTREQIQEEHDFLLALDDLEIPAVAPLALDGISLFENDQGILYTLFPKVKGRLLDELGEDRLRTLGRYIARIHNVGEHFPFRHRRALTAESWGEEPMNFLLDSTYLTPEYKPRYEAVAGALVERAAEALRGQPTLSLHGDCHLGNTLWQLDSPFFLDFDDSMTAPAVQDIWMVVRGRGAEAERDRNLLLEGYEAFRPFPRSSLKLIEPLRALRMIHYSAWIARRWDDPSFAKAFPLFGTHRYWEEEIQALQEILSIMEEG
jgi:Ser/Thr protein kinase RdoA (MazF antagonist)